MCGIAGIVDSRLSLEQGEPLLKRMLDAVRHRGPDHSSQWIEMPVLLGHNRLSIIDVSEAANQPMESDGPVVVHNGEIYNYLELREHLMTRGHRFTTRSDTEVILAAYKEWGGDCVRRFIGMWPFAIWDKKKGVVLLPGSIRRGRQVRRHRPRAQSRSRSRSASKEVRSRQQGCVLRP